MKVVLFTATIAAILATVMANCPSSCSGHGTCGANDKCTCYPNFKGLDCADRVCPYQIAFADVATNDNLAHSYQECSGKGLCDRKSGTCKCFAGYEGQACRRTVCPNLCSGHGTCELMDEIAGDASAAAGGSAGRVYNKWDAKKHQVCKCDAYWGGVDCSERSCPKGDDPLTTHANPQFSTSSFSIEASANDKKLTTGAFTLTYTDTFNGVWTTRPINAPVDAFSAAEKSAVAAAMDVQLALESLPNQVISGCKVTATVTAAASDAKHKVAYDIVFGKSNSGAVGTLSLNAAGCEIEGCQPYFGQLKDNVPAAAVVVAVATTAGNTEHATCSNRGNCDSATGLCSCFSGYYGEACEMQTALF